MIRLAIFVAALMLFCNPALAQTITGGGGCTANCTFTGTTNSGVLNTTTAGTAAAPALTLNSTTTGLYVSGTNFGFAINGVSQFDFGIVHPGAWNFQTQVFNSGGAGFVEALTARPALSLNSTGANYGQVANIDADTWGLLYGASNTTNGTAVFKWTDNGAASVAPFNSQFQVNGGVVGIGSVPTAGGTCPINTQLGGNTIGSFKANGACASGTVILTFAATAANGWACRASDLTTPADAINQTAYAATTATFTATMANADLATFSCFGF